MLNQYLLAVHSVEGQPLPSAEVMKQMYVDVDAINQEMMKAGAWVFGGGLHPVSSATVVREKNGEILFTDGPFSEAKEHIGGFWVIKCKDLDAALKWASKATVACRTPVEVRPFQEPAA
jgi:hypothetical protein